MKLFFKIGEKIGNPQTLNDIGEVTEEAAVNPKPAPLGSMNNYNMGSKSAPVNKTGGYGQPMEKSDVVTHPIVSLTPYQNKYVCWQIVQSGNMLIFFFSPL